MANFIQRILAPLFGLNRSAEDGRKEIDFKLLTDNINDVFMRYGPNAELIYASASLKDLLGWAPEEMIGKRPHSIVHPEDLPVLADAIARSHSKEENIIRSSMRMQNKTGVWIWLEIIAKTIRDPATGELGDTIVVMRDMSERKALEERLSSLALTDGLTGLSNRRAFDETLDREWRRTLREGSQLSLLLIDVDHFKLFNDQYGHQVGDDCLRTIAATLRDEVRRPGDMVARYGGEEIVVILSNTDASGAIQLGQGLCQAVESLRMSHSMNLEGDGVVTVSIGAATAQARSGGTTGMPAGLLQAADTALYRAKSNGRNRVEGSFILAGIQSGEQSAA